MGGRGSSVHYAKGIKIPKQKYINEVKRLNRKKLDLSNFEERLAKEAGLEFRIDYGLLGGEETEGVRGEYRDDKNALELSTDVVENYGEKWASRTVHHEIGHAADDVFKEKNGVRASAQGDFKSLVFEEGGESGLVNEEGFAILKDRWETASDESFSRADYAKILNDSKWPKGDLEVTAHYEELEKHMDYLTKPNEMFAEAYSQFRLSPRSFQKRAPNLFAYFKVFTNDFFKK